LPLPKQLKPDTEILRVHRKKSTFGLKEDCDIMIDRLRAIDNKQLVKKIAKVDNALTTKIKENLKIILDLD